MDLFEKHRYSGLWFHEIQSIYECIYVLFSVLSNRPTGHWLWTVPVSLCPLCSVKSLDFHPFLSYLKPSCLRPLAGSIHWSQFFWLILFSFVKFLFWFCGFRNKVLFYKARLLALRPTPNLEDQVRNFVRPILRDLPSLVRPARTLSLFRCNSQGSLRHTGSPTTTRFVEPHVPKGMKRTKRERDSDFDQF